MKSIFLTIVLSILSVQLSTAQWVQVNNGMGNVMVLSLAYSGNNIFAGTGIGVYLSTNNGANWTLPGSNNQGAFCLAISGNNIFAGTGTGVYLSTNNGTSWTQTPLNESIWSLAVNGNNIFASSGANNGVYLSTDNGTSWIQTPLNTHYIRALAVNGNNVFAGANGYGVYLSTDNGTSWTQTSLNNQSVSSFAINGNNIFAGASYGVYLSTNNGANWTLPGSNNQASFCLAINGNNVFAGTYGNGVYVSNNNGTSWTQRNEGLPAVVGIYSFCILNNYIFAGTGYVTTGQGVYRRPLGELTGIQPISGQLPAHFALEQNYPNPFNPGTVIRYSLIVNGFVSLKVYDILGKEVETLVSENLKPGTYEIDWNASNYPSGIYYYKLTIGDFSETRKAVLIK